MHPLDPMPRAFLIDAIAIVDIEAAGSAEFIIPTIRVFGLKG